MGVEVEVGGSQQVSEFSTVGLSVIAGLQVCPKPNCLYDSPGIILRP
jgi:hypothetical protein